MSRILVVDDEEPLRTLVARGLGMDGHSCVTASDGAEALDVLIAEQPTRSIDRFSRGF